MDDAAVWIEALSPEQVAELHAAGEPRRWNAEEVDRWLWTE